MLKFRRKNKHTRTAGRIQQEGVGGGRRRATQPRDAPPRPPVGTAGK